MTSSNDGSPEHFWASIERDLRACSHLDVAAQLFCERFYATFLDLAVLVRMFVTVPLEALPPTERAFAEAFPTRGADRPAFEKSTPVLTLVGTSGVEPDWNRRSGSRGHQAIPLLSDDFVEEIPMISRLLGEIGFPRLSSRPAAQQFVIRDIIDVNGLFYVGDARTTTDERGRLIIPAFEFVERYGIKSVFGFGGPFAARSTFLTAIVFTRRTMPRSTAAQFVQLIAQMKSATADMIDRDAFFTPH